MSVRAKTTLSFASAPKKLYYTLLNQEFIRRTNCEDLPSRNCLPDIMLGERESNPARCVRTGPLHGRIQLTSTTGHANGVHPPLSLSHNNYNRSLSTYKNSSRASESVGRKTRLARVRQKWKSEARYPSGHEPIQCEGEGAVCRGFCGL